MLNIASIPSWSEPKSNPGTPYDGAVLGSAILTDPSSISERLEPDVLGLVWVGVMEFS